MISKVVVLGLIFTCSFVESKPNCKVLRNHEHFKEFPKPPKCGPGSPSSKIMGGEDANIGEFPWMVTIYKRRVGDKGPKELFCDGSILTNRHVLTAAHCLSPYVKTLDHYLYIRVGEHDVTDYSTRKPREINIVSFKVHEHYNEVTHANDIALVHLAEDIRFDHQVAYPICLPLSCKVITQDLSHTKLILAGWGFVQERPIPSAASVLQKIDMTLVSHKECQEAWHGTIPIDNNQICTRGSEGPGQSPCKGDSGGPLMAKLNNAMYLVGVVSMGDTCIPYNPSDYPSVYAKATAYTQWILDNYYFKTLV